MASLAVILCTHNPRPDYLGRALESLARQTLPLPAWDFLLIDNASTPPLAPDLSFHPRAQVIREEKLGLTPARLRGLRESSADLLVFIDDDNELFPDFLERCLEIERAWPKLGAWGGQTIAEYEVPPPEELRPYLWLAIREFTEDRWTNLPFAGDAIPYGAGLCVRRPVAEAYARAVEDDPVRRSLDRSGAQLLGCGDTDLALTACDLGLGTGLFTALKLIHLIDKRRLDEGYLLRLVEATTYSLTLLSGLRGGEEMTPSRSQRLLRWYEALRLPERVRRFDQAKIRGRENAIRDVQRLRAGQPHAAAH